MYVIYYIEEWYCSSKELLEIVALPDVRRSKVMQTAYLQGMPDCEASEAIWGDRTIEDHSWRSIDT